MMMNKERFDTLISMGIEPIPHNVELPYTTRANLRLKTRVLREILDESCKYPYYVKLDNSVIYRLNKKLCRIITIYFFNKSDYSYHMMKTI